MAYSAEQIKTITDLIITEIANGKSLKSILENNKEMPVRQTVYEWLNPNSDYFNKTFSDNYTRAHEESGDIDAERIAEIGEKTLSGEYDHQSARVAIDALKWTAGIKKPKKYGNKTIISGDDENPIKTQTTQVLDSESIKAIAKELHEKY